MSDTLVTVRLTERGERETELELTHEFATDGEASSHADGWTQIVLRLTNVPGRANAVNVDVTTEIDINRPRADVLRFVYQSAAGRTPPTASRATRTGSSGHCYCRWYCPSQYRRRARGYLCSSPAPVSYSQDVRRFRDTLARYHS